MAQKDSAFTKRLLTLVVVLGVGGFLFMMATSTMQKTVVATEADTVYFFSIYGSAINTADIVSVEMVESIPKIGLKVNGAGLGKYKKGDYQLDGWGTCRLYLHDNTGPYLVLTSTQRRVILNYKDPAETEAVYLQIRDFLTM